VGIHRCYSCEERRRGISHREFAIDADGTDATDAVDFHTRKKVVTGRW
jgi:hypothetical protein